MKYKYFLDTVYDLDTNPLFLIEVEDYVLLYSFKS